MTTMARRDAVAGVDGDRCARCLAHFDDGVEPHELLPDEAAEWEAPAGFYHDGCCPECNGDASPLTPFRDFHAAAQAVLSHLHERLGFDLWTVSRLDGADSIILVAEDHGYGIREGHVFRWSDSFCSRMVARHGPRIAPDSDRVRAYAGAPLRRTLQIGAYIGVPLEGPDGALLGTLCAIHPTPLPCAVRNEQSLVELQARLLSTLLVGELGTSRRA